MIIKALVPAVVAALLTLFHLTKADDFKIIKERVVAELMKTPIDDQVVEAILARMAADGSFRDINYDDLSRTAGFPHRRYTGDLVYLAKAYKNTHSNFHNSSQLKRKIITSLAYWIDHDFFGDNWHDNQISTPTNLVNLMLVFGEELPQDLIDPGAAHYRKGTYGGLRRKAKW